MSRFLTAHQQKLSYTVPFTLVHAGKYRTEDKSKTDNTKTKDNKKSKQHKTQQNQPGSVASYDKRPGNEVELFYNTPEPTRGMKWYDCRTSYGERCRRGHVLDAVRVLAGISDGQLGELDGLMIAVDLQLDALGGRQRLSVEQPVTVCSVRLGQVARQCRRLRLEAFDVLQLQRDLHRLVCVDDNNDISKK